MKLLKLTLAVLAAALVTSGAQAAMVNGAITFAGGAIFDTNSLATATRVNTFKNVKVMSEDGDFEGFVLHNIFQNSFSLLPKLTIILTIVGNLILKVPRGSFLD